MIIDGSESSLKKFLSDLPPVDQVGAEARAAMLATRSIKTSSKAWAIDMAISMVDLTTLEGADTPGKVKALCAKAVRPDPTDLTVPSVGAICVYNDMVKIARNELDAIGGRDIPVAAVATAFPSGRASPRTAMTLAVLELRAGIKISGRDVYVATVGGMKITEPSADLAVALSVASAAKGLALPADLVAIGEVGLAGEIRKVTGITQRVAEAARLGFKRAIVPVGSDLKIAGIEILEASRVEQAISKVKIN